MKSSPAQASTSARLSLVLGLVVIVIAALFTLVSIALVLTGKIVELESSRILNQAYALLSFCGEGIACIGALAGVKALFERGPSRLKAALGAALNLIGLVVFFPAALALLFNGFIG